MTLYNQEVANGNLATQTVELANVPFTRDSGEVVYLSGDVDVFKGAIEVKISSKCILALRLSNSEFFKASDAMVKAAGL